MILVLAVPFFVLFGAIFLLLFTHTSSAHTGAAVNTNVGGGWFGAFKRALITNNPAVALVGAALDKVFHVARGWVSHWALASVKPVARWFDGLTELQKRTYTQMSGLATDTAASLQAMRHVVIPHAAAVAAKPALTEAKHATATASKALVRTQTLSTTFTDTHRAQVKLNVHYTHAIDVALPKQLGMISTREDALSRDVTKLKERTTSLEDGAIDTFKWIRSHATSAATGVFTGAVAVALTSLGWGVLRCRSWKGLGQKLTCGMGSWLTGLLEAIATFALATFSVLDPEALAEAAVAAVDTVEPLLAEILSK